MVWFYTAVDEVFHRQKLLSAGMKRRTPRASAPVDGTVVTFRNFYTIGQSSLLHTAWSAFCRQMAEDLSLFFLKSNTGKFTTWQVLFQHVVWIMLSSRDCWVFKPRRQACQACSIFSSGFCFLVRYRGLCRCRWVFLPVLFSFAHCKYEFILAYFLLKSWLS